MLIYPKQSEQIGKKCNISIIYKKEYTKATFICLRDDDKEIPGEWIGICTKCEKFPKLQNKLMNQIGLYYTRSIIPKKYNYDSKIPNIRVGKLEGNIIYKIYTNRTSKNCIFIIVYKNRYLKFYPSYEFDIDTTDWNPIIYPVSSSLNNVKYKLLDSRKFISRTDVFTFLIELLGEYELWKG